MTVHDTIAFPLPVRLRRARQLAGLDQHQLAERLGVARNTVSNYETGRSEPTASAFVRWAAATGVTLGWLAEGIPPLDATDTDPAPPSWHRAAS